MDTTISLLINGFLTLLGVVLGHFVTKYTYIFQRNYERKSDLVVDLYKEVIRLEFALKKYVHFTGAETGEGFKQRKIDELNHIKNNFQKFQYKFWEVEIILEENIVEKINHFLQTYIAITSKLTVSNISQQLSDHGQSFDKWNESFEAVSNDLVKVKEELKKDFKKALQK